MQKQTDTLAFVAIAISVAELHGLHLRQKLATMFVKCKEYECYVRPCLTTPRQQDATRRGMTFWVWLSASTHPEGTFWRCRPAGPLSFEFSDFFATFLDQLQMSDKSKALFEHWFATPWARVPKVSCRAHKRASGAASLPPVVVRSWDSNSKAASVLWEPRCFGDRTGYSWMLSWTQKTNGKKQSFAWYFPGQSLLEGRGHPKGIWIFQ